MPDLHAKGSEGQWDELHHRGSGATQPTDGVRQNVVAHAPTRHSRRCLAHRRRFQYPDPPVDGRKPRPVNSPDRQQPTTTAGQMVKLEQPGGELAAVIADRGVLAQRGEEINILLPRLIVALDLFQQ